MLETMSLPTWNEYLKEARRHLEASRIAAATGGPPPDLPDRPADPIPQELVGEAKTLAASYEELAIEVAERLDEIRNQSQQLKRRPRKEQVVPSYVDTTA